MSHDEQPMAIDSGSWSLWCQPIDIDGNLLCGPCVVDVLPSLSVYDFKKAIHAEARTVMVHIDACQLDLYKPSQDLLNLPPDEVGLQKITPKLKFPDLTLHSTEHVERLNSYQNLSTYWNMNPEENRIHIIARAPIKRSQAAFYSSRKDETDSTISSSSLKRSKGSGLSTVSSAPTHLLDELRESVWGANSLAHIIKKVEVKKEPSAIDENIELPSHVWVLEVDKELKPALGCCPKIMILQEYIEALKSLFTSMGLDTSNLPTNINTLAEFRNPLLNVTRKRLSNPIAGFMLTGQPGIGKTQWLFFLLILRLHARLPTLFQYRASRVLLFHEGGVSILPTNNLHHLDDLRRLRPDIYKTIWVLVDSNQSLISVSQEWLDRDFMIIQTPSPRVERTSWMTKPSNLVDQFIMKPWTLMEILSGSQFQQSSNSHQAIATFFDKHRTSPHDVYRYSTAMNQYEKAVLAALAFRDIEAIRTLLSDAATLNFSHGISQYLLTLHPGNDRYSVNIRLASRFVVKHLVDQLERSIAEDADQLFSVFLQSPFSKSSAELLLDYAIHYIFPKGGSWPLVQASSSTGPINDHHKLDLSSEPQHYLHISQDHSCITRNKNENPNPSSIWQDQYSHTSTKSLEDGYYLPMTSTQAACDAFIYKAETKHALLLQATIATEHDIKRAGIERLRLLGVNELTYIVVVPKLQQEEVDIVVDKSLGLQNVYFLRLDSIKSRSSN